MAWGNYDWSDLYNPLKANIGYQGIKLIRNIGGSSGDTSEYIGNIWDKFKNGNTNEINQEIANQNLEFQRENFDYQKALQEQIFDREDTSYQRTVNDMRQAGLNPLTMNGTNGAGEAIATTPLNNNFQMQDKGTGTVISDLIGMMNSMQNYQIGISYGKEQEAKAQSAEAQAKIDLATAINKIENSEIDTKTKRNLYEDFTRNMNFNKDMNIFNGMDNNSRDTRIMQALDSNNKQTAQFAQNYIENGIQYNGLKIMPFLNMITSQTMQNKMGKLIDNLKKESKKNNTNFFDWLFGNDIQKNGHGATGKW